MPAAQRSRLGSSQTRVSAASASTASAPALLRLGLVGSPNSGKTTLFNALTGMRDTQRSAKTEHTHHNSWCDPSHCHLPPFLLRCISYGTRIRPTRYHTTGRIKLREDEIDMATVEELTQQADAAAAAGDHAEAAGLYEQVADLHEQDGALVLADIFRQRLQ